MKQILLIFLSVFLFFTTLNAQDFWEKLNFPEDLIISCVKLNNQGEIFVGTVIGNDKNGVYKSSDTGKTWVHVLNTGTFQVNAIGIDKSDHVFVHANGLHQFWISTDDGETFNELPWNNTAVTEMVSLGTDSLLLGCVGPGMGVLVLRTHDACNSFDTLYKEVYTAIHQITDMAVGPNGEIYFSLMCYFPNEGGVYRTTDDGSTWTELGLLNSQVNAVKVNALGDVFMGVFHDFNWGAGGLYALYHDSSTLDTCIFGPEVNGITINSAGDIYAGTSYGVIVSKDNGLTYENRNSGLVPGVIGNLVSDNNDYIFACHPSPSNILYRTVNSTVTGIKIPNRSISIEELFIYPNPTTDLLQIKLHKYSLDKENLDCYILDNNYKLVFSREIQSCSNEFSLDITNLPSGIYHLTLFSKSKIYFASFIKL